MGHGVFIPEIEKISTQTQKNYTKPLSREHAGRLNAGKARDLTEPDGFATR